MICAEGKGSQNVWLVFPLEMKPDGSEEGVEDNVTGVTTILERM